MGLRKLGAHTFGFVWEQTAEATIQALAAEGFRSFQLLASPPHIDPFNASNDELNAIRSAVAACGGRIVSVDLPASEFNLASPIKDAARFSVEMYKRTVEFAAAIGSEYITVTSGRRHALLPAPQGHLEAIFTDSFDQIVEAAERAGIRVLLENHPHGVLPDAESMVRFLSDARYDSVDVLYDAANAAAINEDPVEGLRKVLPKTGVVHLSDAPNGSWRHDPIGAGDIEFGPIMELLKSAGYARHVVAEIISDAPLRDLIEAREYFSPILNVRN
ncbi:sugar phosphate isomerase/epimerase family protein [Microvirga aerophila]|nr:sugar phosphate isomerase/epimerase family protein [Microvirga aerophila]